MVEWIDREGRMRVVWVFLGALLLSQTACSWEVVRPDKIDDLVCPETVRQEIDRLNARLTQQLTRIADLIEKANQEIAALENQQMNLQTELRTLSARALLAEGPFDEAAEKQKIENKLAETASRMEAARNRISQLEAMNQSLNDSVPEEYLRERNEILAKIKGALLLRPRLH